MLFYLTVLTMNHAHNVLQLAFKDITGLVEQNVQLRRLVRSLSEEIENRERELKVC